VLDLLKRLLYKYKYNKGVNMLQGMYKPSWCPGNWGMP